MTFLFLYSDQVDSEPSAKLHLDLKKGFLSVPPLSRLRGPERDPASSLVNKGEKVSGPSHLHLFHKAVQRGWGGSSLLITPRISNYSDLAGLCLSWLPVYCKLLPIEEVDQLC